MDTLARQSTVRQCALGDFNSAYVRLGVMNGPKAMSALSPFDSQLRTFVGTARGSYFTSCGLLHRTCYHSIVTSARSWNDSGIQPKRLGGGFEVATSLKYVGCSTGMSAGTSSVRVSPNAFGRTSAGGRKFDKARSTGRIDALVAVAMALSLALLRATKPIDIEAPTA